MYEILRAGTKACDVKKLRLIVASLLTLPTDGHYLRSLCTVPIEPSTVQQAGWLIRRRGRWMPSVRLLDLPFPATSWPRARLPQGRSAAHPKAGHHPPLVRHFHESCPVLVPSDLMIQTFDRWSTLRIGRQVASPDPSPKRPSGTHTLRTLPPVQAQHASLSA